MGNPYFSTGTCGQILSCTIRDCLDDFDITIKIVSYTNDDGENLWTYKRALDHVADNSDIINPKQPISEQSCITHVLQGACKASVVYVESENKTLSIGKQEKSFKNVLPGLRRVTRA